MTEAVPPTLYRRPGLVRRALVNPLVRCLVSRGRLGRSEQNLMRVLRVRGRVSGLPRDVPIRIAVRDGGRYVVSLLGETEWARNLRAAGTAQLLLGPDTETVTAQELTGAEKEGFLHWYCGVPEHGLSVRGGLRIPAGRPTAAQLARAAAQHPVFRLVQAV